MNDKEFADCVLSKLPYEGTGYFDSIKVAAAFEILENIKDGKLVITDADELIRLRDLQSKWLDSPAPDKPSKIGWGDVIGIKKHRL